MEAERQAATKAARRRRIITVVVVTALVLGVAALISVVGGDEDGEETADQAAAPETTTTTAPEKPEVTVPEGQAPTTLQTTDLVVGDGEEAQTGDTLRVHYVGKLYATGEEFDSSYEREPVEVQLVSPGIIEGWVQGLTGVRAGGRRQLVIPPDLGYGAEPSGDIPANSTLVFVIDVLSVEKAATPGG